MDWYYLFWKLVLKKPLKADQKLIEYKLQFDAVFVKYLIRLDQLRQKGVPKVPKIDLKFPQIFEKR